MKPLPRKRDRSGYTLVEMVTVIGLMTSILGLASVLMRRSVACYSQSLEQATALATQERWCERIRSDLSQSDLATISDDAKSLTLVMSETERIQYEIVESGLTRQRTLSGRTLPIESWKRRIRSVGAESEWFSLSFVVQKLPRGQLVQLWLGGQLFLESRLGATLVRSTDPVSTVRGVEP